MPILIWVILGVLAFNVLFADGHVTTLISRAEGHKVARMRYPG